MKYPAGANSSSELAAVFVLFCRKRRGCHNPRRILRSSFKRRMPECQSGDAGAIPADRTIFKYPHQITQCVRRAPACAAESPKLCGLGAAPRRRAISSNRGGARWEGSGLISRQRAGSIPAPATNFMGRSTIQEVTRLASGRARCKAVAVHFFQIAGRLRTRGVS